MVEKEVENSNSISQIQFEVLKYLTQFLTITEIAKQRKTSRTAVYKQINKLLEKGYIRKLDKSFGVTDLGNRGLHSFIGFTNNIRLHNLAIKIQLKQKPRNWDLKRTKLAQIRIHSKQVNIKNNSYEIHPFSNVKIKTTTNSIIFYLPATYGKNTDEAFKTALDILWKSIPKVEDMFNIFLIKDKSINLEIISNHYSKLQDSLAKLYRKQGDKLYITDEKGKVWLIADFSFRVDELETIDTIKAKEDMDVVKSFFNELRKEPVTTTQILGMIRDVTANQVVFDRNMKSHIEVIRGIGKGMNQLTKALKEVKTENIKLRQKQQTSLEDF
ncbi:MAG: MarR family transcriptional regulator [Nanoarchaeota archaeon]|nr:MarR family transcriptional regulator [Nanoarchaeota archaeon]